MTRLLVFRGALCYTGYIR